MGGMRRATSSLQQHKKVIFLFIIILIIDCIIYVSVVISKNKIFIRLQKEEILTL